MTTYKYPLIICVSLLFIVALSNETLSEKKDETLYQSIPLKPKLAGKCKVSGKLILHTKSGFYSGEFNLTPVDTKIIGQHAYLLLKTEDGTHCSVTPPSVYFNRGEILKVNATCKNKGADAAKVAKVSIYIVAQEYKGTCDGQVTLETVNIKLMPMPRKGPVIK